MSNRAGREPGWMSGCAPEGETMLEAEKDLETGTVRPREGGPARGRLTDVRGGTRL
jgi:hypothetical protein